MNNRKQYSHGTRRDIIYILHCAGILTYRGIRVLPEEKYNKRTVQRKIHEMVDEGVLGKQKPAIEDVQQQFFYMRNYESNCKEITVAVSKECVDFYRDYFKEGIRSLWSIKSSQTYRKIMESDLITFIYAAGIDAMPDQRNGESKFFSSREVKRYTGYKDEVKETEGERKVQFSKVFGLILSSGGNYGVYHTYKSGLSKLSGGEYKILAQLGKIVRQMKGEREEITSALVVVNDLDSLIGNIDIENLNTKYALNYYNFTSAYKSIYALPYTKEGRDMLTLMTKRGWRQRLIEAATGEMQDTSYVNYVCDHYDKESKVGTLVFCIPDIVRLKKFLEIAKLQNDRKKFRIICFDYQKEFVKKVIGHNAQIYTTSFEEYYKGEK